MSVKNKKILVVDDEESVRDILQEILEVEGFKPDFASDGEKAIKMLEKKEYDLVITDLMMPKKGGLEVLEKAKEHYHDIVVLMLTGHGTLESAIKSIQLGANDYITKPFKMTDIINRIYGNFRAQDLERENIRLQKQTEEDRNRLRKIVYELAILQRLGVNFSYTFSISELYSLITESLSQVIKHDFCAILDLKNKKITVKTNNVLNSRIVDWIKAEMVEYLKSQTKAGIQLDEIEVEIAADHIDEKLKIQVKSNFNVLLWSKDNPFGVINVSSYHEGAFNEDDERFLHNLAKQSSNVLSRLKDVIESQKEKLQRIIDSIPDAMIMFDVNDNTILVNPIAEKIIEKYSDNGVTLHSVQKTFNIEFKELLHHLQTHKTTLRKEFTFESDESKYIYDANIALLGEPDGLIQGLVMVLRDVTRERELDEMKRDFISNVSHELRTPAAIIKEFISIISDGVAGKVNKEQKDYLGIMHNNTERLLRLIENLLYMSRIEAGRFKIKKVPMDMNELLQRVKESLEIRLLKNKQKLLLKIPKKLPELKADPDAVTQIVYNYVDNARKFSPADSTIIIQSLEENGKIVTSIEDNGRGILSEHLDKIFERFRRIEDSRDEKKEGVGLGLPIVKELAALHGGDAWVKSTIKKGSTFYFSLPLDKKKQKKRTK